MNGDSVLEAVQELNDTVFLPGVQREYVWEKDDIVMLFDSVVEGYPIGELLLWEQDELTEEQIVYRFMQHKAQEPIEGADALEQEVEKHPHIEDVEWVEYRNETVGQDLKEQVSQGTGSIDLVLDGQQRLTALNIGLRGSLWNPTDAGWSGKSLYINLLHTKRENPPSQSPRNNLEFLSYTDDFVKRGDDSMWMRLGAIYDYYEQHGKDAAKELADEFYEVADDAYAQLEGPNDISSRPDELADEEERVYYAPSAGKVYYTDSNPNTTIRSLVNTFQQGYELNYETETTSSPDAVLEAFIRTNRQGQELDKYEMMLGILNNYWSKRGVNAREEINQFIEKVNSKDGYSYGYYFNVEKTLKAIATCIDEVNYDYDDTAFTEEEVIDEVTEAWGVNDDGGVLDGDIQQATIDAVDFLRELGFDRRLMKNNFKVVAPIIYYFFQRDEDEKPSFDSEEKRRIEYFVAVTLLDNDYGRRFADADLDEPIFRKIRENDSFPVYEIYDEMDDKDSDYVPRPTEGDIYTALDRSNLDNSGQAYGLFRLMYFPYSQSNTSQDYERDHLHPQSKLSEGYLSSKGVDSMEQDIVDEKADAVANRALIDQNREKGDEALKSWVSRQHDKYYLDHFLPSDDDELAVEDIRGFLGKREEIIVEYMLSTFDEDFLEGDTDFEVDKREQVQDAVETVEEEE